MKLYTVRMVRKQLVTKFDSAGKVTSKEEILIPQVYTDLPYVTACGYRDKFPDAKVKIEAQDAVVERTSKRERDYSPKIRGKISKPPAPSMIPRTSAATHAAVSGDMSAALNKAMEKV
jgi:hypothetical protein